MSLSLITGASGQIGNRLFQSLRQDDTALRTLGRQAVAGAEHVYADLEWATSSELQKACRDVDVVYHCAGYAHAYPTVGNKDSDADLHRRVNLEATKNLAEAAAQAGVKNFVFLSSVKATGEPGAACVDETWPEPPQTTYGKAKRAAELAIMETAARTGMKAVNLRLAMVYGGTGYGNLERMIAVIRRGFFPPLPETGNKRTMVYIDDVVSAIRAVANDARAAGRTYIVAEKQHYSGRQIYNAVRQAFGMKPMPVYMPHIVLRLGAYAGDGLEMLSGKRMPLDSEVLDKLLGSACYNPASIERELGWSAATSLPQGLAKMAKGQAV
jgi:nucleoside-diphosphate-sugar epimerase